MDLDIDDEPVDAEQHGAAHASQHGALPWTVRHMGGPGTGATSTVAPTITGGCDSYRERESSIRSSAMLWSMQYWVRMSPGGTSACSHPKLPSSSKARELVHVMGWWGSGAPSGVLIALDADRVACRLIPPSEEGLR
jgi:hypothetical protein